LLLPSWEASDPSGVGLEGRGIEPDIAAKPGGSATRDGVIEAGLAWLRKG
jgi:C-terminal processing protease CtpA/Prc